MPTWTVTVIRYIILGLFATGLVLGGYQAWKKLVAANARNEVIAAQLSEAVAQVNRTNRDLRAIMDEADALRSDLAKKNQALEERNAEIEGMIRKSQDRPSSEVLKETVKRLGK